MWQDAVCKYFPYIYDLAVKWTDLAYKRITKLHKCHACSLRCVTHISMSIEKEAWGNCDPIQGCFQHLNHSGGMTNQLKDSRTRDKNLWSLCCSAGVVLSFREFFLMLKCDLLQCNPISSCLAYDRHEGHTISFLCCSLLCIQWLLFSPQSLLLWVNTHSSMLSRLLTDLTALLPSPSSRAQLSVYTVSQPPLGALAKGTADADPHRPFFPTTELLPHPLLLTVYLCCRLLLHGWWTLHFTGFV